MKDLRQAIGLDADSKEKTSAEMRAISAEEQEILLRSAEDGRKEIYARRAEAARKDLMLKVYDRMLLIAGLFLIVGILLRVL